MRSKLTCLCLCVAPVLVTLSGSLRHTKNTGKHKQQVRSLCDKSSRGRSDTSVIILISRFYAFYFFFFFSYFSMIVLVFCILCFNLCPRTEQLQFPHFPSLSKASGFSLTTPIPRLVSAILQEFAITRRKKKKEKKNRSKQKCAWLCSVLLSPATDVLYTKKHNHSQDASMCTQCR